MTKLKVWQKLYDYTDNIAIKWEIIAIDNKWRYICEFEDLKWEVFAYDKLPNEIHLKEKEKDWIDDVINSLNSEWIINRWKTWESILRAILLTNAPKIIEEEFLESKDK